VLGFLLATAFWLLFGIMSLPDAIAAFAIAALLVKWQTLAGAIVASIVASTAAYIAFHNTTRSLRHAEELETRRRKRKHAAVRALLPLALARVLNYAEQLARTVDVWVHQCRDDVLPPQTMIHVQPVPSETLSALADFIEYSDDPLDVQIVQDTVAWIQILDSRLRGLVERNRDPSGARPVPRI
jgi:hypothetical protein